MTQSLSSDTQLSAQVEKITLVLPPKTPVPACFGAVQVGYDSYGYAVWKKDGAFFTCPSDQRGHVVPLPLEEKDIVRWLPEPWPYPFED